MLKPVVMTSSINPNFEHRIPFHRLNPGEQAVLKGRQVKSVTIEIYNNSNNPAEETRTITYTKEGWV